MSARALVVAKAPVAGLAKTRLGARIGYAAAADLAAAALLDTLDACADAFGSDCHLALTGDLDSACRAGELRSALRSWRVFEQRGATFGERLAHAHRTVAAAAGPVVQVGMDTPQVSADLLREAADHLDTHSGVLGPAPDGGWWLLGLARPAAAEVLAGVPMSTPRTAFDTRRALAGWGVRLATTRPLRDVDTVEDAEIVAREAPGSRFAEAWARVGVEVAS
jgi:rSAM/selenodomain-associated transferase 1